MGSVIATYISISQQTRYEAHWTSSCEGQAYGYFADVDNNCEVFHICYPLTDETGRITEYLKWSFFCGNGTVFDQEALVCNHPEDAFPCEESPSLYGSTQFGQVEEELDYY